MVVKCARLLLSHYLDLRDLKINKQIKVNKEYDAVAIGIHIILHTCHNFIHSRFKIFCDNGILG